MHPDCPLSTGPDAAAAYRAGLGDLLAGQAGAAVAAFVRSVELDPAFALGHVALGLACAEVGAPGEAPTADVPRARGVTRWERQHLAVVRLVLGGDLERAAALGREHLAEFGGDAMVRFAVTRHCADVDDLVPGYDTTPSGASPPRANASA